MTPRGGTPDWINPATRRVSCPECRGFGYHEDGTAEGRECETCGGSGVASKERAEAFLRAREERQ